MPEWLRFAKDYYLMIYALFVMILMAVCPEGVVGLWKRAVNAARHKRMNAASGGAAS